MPKQKVRVAVLGAGIIGLSSALVTMDSIPNTEVTIIADKFTPNTTSDVAAGLWHPYALGDVPDETLRFWCQETFTFLLKLSQTADASVCGVGLLSAYRIRENPEEDPSYSDIFLHWRDLTEKELLNFPSRFRYGKFYTTIYAECSKLLPYLMQKYKAKGGKLKRRKIQSLHELIGEYDVVINCPGVRAAGLVPDTTVQPIRGQIIRAYAPWIKHAVSSEDFHILPNGEWVVCGGTLQKGNWNQKVEPVDRDRIWKGCCEMVPSLKKARVVKELVGLRPGRFTPRIEREIFNNEIGDSLEVVHNYGHGGSGVTLFWGCAKDAVKLVEDCVCNVQKLRLSSNL